MASQNAQAGMNRPDEGSFPLGPPARSGQALPPPKEPLIGHTTSLVPLQPAHAPALYKHLGGEENAWRWTYMLSGGYPNFTEFETAVVAWSASRDRDYYVIMSSPGPDDDGVEALGLVAYLAVSPQMRRLEIGGVILGGALTRSRRATEAFFLFLRHAFEDLGYTRVEWKANQLNTTSMRAATRLGFKFEGVFRYVLYDLMLWCVAVKMTVVGLTMDVNVACVIQEAYGCQGTGSGYCLVQHDGR